MTTAFKFLRDSNDENTFCLPISDIVARALVPADTLVSLPVPVPDLTVAVISATGNYYVGTEPITLPASPTFALEPGPGNKPSIALKQTDPDDDVTTLYFICPEETAITVEFFARYVKQQIS